MLQARRFIIPTVLVYLAAWSLPVKRALSFLSYARDYYSHTWSNDAASDLSLANGFIIAYAIAISVGLISVLLAAGRHKGLFSAVYAMAFMIPVWLILLRPEEPIALFPVLDPFSVIKIAVAPLVLVLVPWGRLIRRLGWEHKYLGDPDQLDVK